MDVGQVGRCLLRPFQVRTPQVEGIYAYLFVLEEQAEVRLDGQGG